MNGRRSTAVYGVVFGYSSILVSLARNVFFVPIYLHSISLAEYGAWLATGGALALMLINDFGLSGVVTQKISAALGAGDLAALGPLAGSAQIIGLLMALGLTAISLIFVPFLPGLESLSALQKHTVVNCFAIAVGANAAGLVGATAISVLRSLQKAALAGSIVLCADLVNVAVTLIGLFLGGGLYAIAAGMLARSLILALAAPFVVWVVCSRSLHVALIVRWSATRELLGDSSRFFLSAVAMKIQLQANVFFVNSILGPTSAAIYSLTVRAHETVQMLIGQINAALLPSVTHLFGSGNLARFRSVLLRMLISLAGVTAFAMSLTIILNAGFLRLWVGSYGFAGQSVSLTMGAALFVSTLGYVAYDALVAQGKFKLVANAFVLTSLLQVLLLVTFLGRGAWFAPTATLITALIWGLFFWRNVGAGIGMTLSEVLGSLSELGRIVGVSAVVIAGFLVFYPVANTWGGLAAEALACVVALASGYLLLSAQIRFILREEIGMTLRSLRPT